MKRIRDMIRTYSHNNIYHITIKMRPIDIAEYNVDSNDKDPNFKIGDHARISKYKYIFAKGYTANWSGNVFVMNKIKNIAP